MDDQRFIPPLPMQELRMIQEENNETLKRMFHKRIRGNFLISIKKRVLDKLGPEELLKKYNLCWSDEKMVTGIGEAPEYDICRMIVGIHRARTIFDSDKEIRLKEKNEEYRQQVISETVEKVKLRLYGSIYFRKQVLLSGEDFLYYPLPYELFTICTKINELFPLCNTKRRQLYIGIMYNAISALMLMEGGLLGNAYPMCRGAIELYLKLLMVLQTKSCKQYERFREFEIKYSCDQKYPKEFQRLYEKRSCQNSKNKADYLHYGWVDFIDGYHEVAGKYSYSLYGIILFLKAKMDSRISELEELEYFYRSCHAYTHGSIQGAIYPVLHYFEISIMLYYIVCGTFAPLCKESGMKPVIAGMDIVEMAERDFKIMYRQYKARSTENFESYYKL